jgi:hypothetical protein
VRIAGIAVLLGLIIACFVGCAGDLQSIVDTNEPPAPRPEPATIDRDPIPPDDKLKPAGTSWFCFRDKELEHSSACRRTREECDALRGAAAGMDAKTSTRFSECAEQEEATCSTYVDKRMDARRFDCYEKRIDCAPVVTARRKQVSFFSDVSDCGSW